MAQTLPKTGPRKSDKWIPLYFVAFFLVIGSVDAIFVTLALRTNTGVITDKAYEKGLAYNDTLAKAKAQAALNLHDTASYDNGVLNWTIEDAQGKPLAGAKITAQIIRPSFAGNDVTITLTEQENGTYTAPFNPTLKGKWAARLEATWDKNTYNKTLSFTVK